MPRYRSTIAFATIAILGMMTCSGYAGIIWKPGNVQFRYEVDPNGGIFFEAPANFYPAESDTETLSSVNGDWPNRTAEGSLSPFSPPYPLHLHGLASQGRNLKDGLAVRAAAQIIFSEHFDPDIYGIDATQEVTSWITKTFNVDEPVSLTVRALLTGLVDFFVYESSPGSYDHSTFELEASVALEGLTDTYPQQSVFNLIIPIDVQNNNRTAEQQVTLMPTTDNGYRINYKFKTKLIIKTKVQNLIRNTMIIGNGDLFQGGPFNVGTAFEPMELRAVLSPDPVCRCDLDWDNDCDDSDRALFGELVNNLGWTQCHEQGVECRFDLDDDGDSDGVDLQAFIDDWSRPACQ